MGEPVVAGDGERLLRFFFASFVSSSMSQYSVSLSSAVSFSSAFPSEGGGRGGRGESVFVKECLLVSVCGRGGEGAEKDCLWEGEGKEKAGEEGVELGERQKEKPCDVCVLGGEGGYNISHQHMFKTEIFAHYNVYTYTRIMNTYTL